MLLESLYSRLKHLFLVVFADINFEPLVPENACLRGHISQRSILRYVKIVVEHFDERQQEDFCNSCHGFLSEFSDLRFSAQLIQYLVFCCIRTNKRHELWLNLQDHLARFGIQEHLFDRQRIKPIGNKLDLALTIEGVFNALDNNVEHLGTPKEGTSENETSGEAHKGSGTSGEEKKSGADDSEEAEGEDSEDHDSGDSDGD
ncbi:Hypothetical predicted protein [Olea europaea subsp. europaea]|uniref:Uncharacterized protein n=1 Tax=Olea europaea subsp. europaea TaxID=158383 RepID=A0A8S0SKI0_OLEEU|nr:Hypothetical predicted protein [Olea europaea subsp. europaea]